MLFTLAMLAFEEFERRAPVKCTQQSQRHRSETKKPIVLHNITHSVNNSRAGGIKITTQSGSSTTLKQSAEVLPRVDECI